MIKMISASLILSFLFFTAGTAARLEMKSATVAGFINKGKSNQNNINIIMIKSLSTFLTKISTNITPYKDAEAVARQNNFWDQKELDSGQAINIAQHFSTEQVITGDYIVSDKTGTLIIDIFVYNVINGQLLFQRTYRGNAGPEIFDTIDRMILDVSGLLVGKPLEIGFVRVKIKPGNIDYKLFVNDQYISSVSSKQGFIDKFIAGQQVILSLKTGRPDREVMRKSVDIEAGATNEIDFNPAGILIVETEGSGNDIYTNGFYAGKTDAKGELKIPDVEAGVLQAIDVKNGGRELSVTNVEVNESEIKVVIFKTPEGNNNTPASQPGKPALRRFTIGVAFVKKFPDTSPNVSFLNELKGYNGITNTVNDSGYLCAEINALYRVYDFLAVGPFLNLPFENNSALRLSTQSFGAIIRFIPFSFLTKDSESMLYSDLKLGVGLLGPQSQLNNYNQQGENVGFWTEQGNFSPYAALSVGGLFGLGPVQLGISIGYEYCPIGDIGTQISGGQTFHMNTTLDNSCFFIQANLNFNF